MRLAISVLVFLIVLALIVPHFLDVHPPFIFEVLLAPTWLIGKLVGRLFPPEAKILHLLAALILVPLNILLYPVVTYVALSVLSKVLSQIASDREDASQRR